MPDLTIVQALLTIGATGAGIYVAIAGLRAWKSELTGRRDIELCQKVIESFYEAEQKMRELRSPMSYPELESANRPRKNDEGEQEKRLRDQAFVPLSRLEKQNEFWVNFFSLKFRMRALFGDNAVAAYEKMDECLRHFRVSAITIYQGIHGSTQEISNDDLWRFQKDIWESGEDAISKKMQAAISAMEAVCIPIVRHPKWRSLRKS